MTPFAVGVCGIDALLGAAASLGRCACPYWTMRICSPSVVVDADRLGSDCFQCRRFVCALAADDSDRVDCTDTAAASVQNAGARPPLELTPPLFFVCVLQGCVDGTKALLTVLCRLVLSAPAVVAPADPSDCVYLETAVM